MVNIKKMNEKLMVRYHKKVFFFNVYESWFTYKYEFWNIFSLNAFFHLKDFKNTKVPGIQDNSYTIELNLEQDKEIIIANFSKQIRQQTKIAESEGTICYFHNDVDKFISFFNEFAIKKHIITTSKDVIIKMGNTVKMSFAVHNGQILAAHSYLVDTEVGIVRHLHSATKRLDDQYDRNLIGRVNKYLTVNDIFYFKEMGFKIFDFGGYAKDTTNDSLKGINNYKLLFGGSIVTCINYYSYNYWLLKRLSRLLKLSGKM